MSSGITFIILLQAELLLMAIAAAIYFYLRYRKITLSGSEEAAVNSVPIPSPPSPTSKELLQSKIRQTRQRLAEMEGDETIGNEIKQCLQTRINLLELEMEYLDADESNDSTWASLQEKLAAMMPAAGPAAHDKSTGKQGVEEAEEFQTVISRQRQAIENLMESLGDVEATAVNIEEMQKTQTLFQRFERELGMCVATLKMENQRRDADGAISITDTMDSTASSQLNAGIGEADQEDTASAAQDSTHVREEDSELSPLLKGFDLANKDEDIDTLLEQSRPRE